MSITMMISRESYLADPTDVQVVRDYWGHEAGLKHSKRCVHYTGRTDGTRDELLADCCRDRVDQGDYDHRSPCSVVQPLYMRTTHQGLVLSEGENNRYDDSDFYADVWNPTDRKIERIYYATTRGWTYPNRCTVDATPETRAAVAAYQQHKAAERRQQLEAQAQQAAAAQAAIEAERARVAGLRGREVTVGKGKKSFTGILFWVGLSRSGDSVRIGIKDSQGSVKWCASSAVA